MSTINTNSTSGSTAVGSTSLAVSQNTASAIAVENVKTQAAALSQLSSGIADTQASIQQQQAILNDAGSSKKEKAAAVASMAALSTLVESQQAQLAAQVAQLNQAVAALPQAQAADDRAAKQATDADKQQEEITEAADISKAAQDVADTASKNPALLQAKQAKLSGLIDKVTTLAAKSSAATGGATATSGVGDSYSGEAETTSTGLRSAVVNQLQAGASETDIDNLLSGAGLPQDTIMSDLVKEAVTKAKQGGFDAANAKQTFDDLLSSIDKAFKGNKSTGNSSSKQKSTGNAGSRAVATVGNTSFAGTGAAGTSGTAGTGASVTANAGGTGATATGNAGGGETAADYNQQPDLSGSRAQAQAEADADSTAEPVSETDAVAGMSVNEMLMYVMLLATQEMNHEMRDQAKELKDQTAKKTALRAEVNDARAAYTAAGGATAQSDTKDSGKADAANKAKDNLETLQSQMDSIGDDMQMQQLRLQNMTQVQQQMIQGVSALSKSLNDTSMSIIRKIGG